MLSSTPGIHHHGIFALLLASVVVAGACENSTSTPNRPPETPAIASPQDGAAFQPGEPVQLQGSADDPEDGPLSGVRLSWSSNQDGQLGTGGSLTVTTLSEGAHTITLRATDSDGLSSTASVQIEIQNEPPTVQIGTPADGASFSPGEEIDFEGSATDPEDGALTGGDLVWSSSRDGQLGTGASLSRDDLSDGTHTITLTATDAGGKTGTATVSITVEDQAPTVTIQEPDDGDAAPEGAVVQFQGSANDPEDGNLSGGSLVWTSDLDGQIGTGTSFNRSNLSRGEHTITLTATDSNDNSASASVDLTIQGAPTATIAAPLGGATFQLGTPITFQGSANDPEDGPLIGGSLVWTSDVDGQIGTAETFSTAALSEGDHTITLTATDSDGLTGTATVDITVQTISAPVATINTPTNGASFPFGTQITFTGTATDAEDGDLTGGNLIWTSNLDGQIGTGTFFTRSNLSVGTHQITLRATDSSDRVGTAAITIIITSPPSATITQPAVDAHFSEGAPVTFTGSGNDPEDGALTGGSLVWTSSLDGEIGTGETFQTASLSRGEHTITLTATDSDGLTGSTSRTITIDPPGSPPTVTITAPADGGSAAQGANVTFQGTATDVEDGNLTGASLIWTSNRDGQLATGASFSSTTLSAGTHTITLEATDSDGWVSTDQITYTITSSASPIEVKVGATASSAISTGAQTTLPIIVDMSNAGGRDVASIQVRVTWSTGVATHVSSSSTIGATINTGNAGAGEVIANWFSGSGNTTTFTVFNITLEGASAGATTVTVEVQSIADELATDLSGDTATRNHSLTVN